MATLFPKYRAALPLALVTVVALATSLFQLGNKGLWGDEVWETMWSRQQDFIATFLRFKVPPDLPLQFLLTNISTFADDSPFFARLPSALLAVGTAITLFLLAKRLFGVRVALLAAILLALAPYQVWYAQEARPYAALSFYSLLSLFFFWSLLDRVTFWRAFGFAIATCLNIYNHLFGVLPLFTEGVAAVAWALALFFSSQRLDPAATQADRKRVLNTLLTLGASALVAIALCFPILGGIAGFIAQGSPNRSGQIASAHFDLTLSFFTDLLGWLGAGAGVPFLIMFALFVFGIGAAVRLRQWFWAMAVEWITLPLLILWTVQPEHLFITRYVLFIQPVYLLMIAYGMKKLVDMLGSALKEGSRLASFSGSAQRYLKGDLAIILSISLCAMVFAPTLHGYTVRKVTDWSAICSYLWNNTGPGDVVVADDYGYGTMTWCFDVKMNAPYVPVTSADSFDLSDALAQRRGVWYVNVDPSAPHLTFVRGAFQQIPASMWSDPNYTDPSDSDLQFYPEGENQAAIYHFSPTEPPSTISFHEMKGSDVAPTWPDFVEIPSGRNYSVRLSLPATAPRQIRLSALHLNGRTIDVSVDGNLLGTISDTSANATWEDSVFPLPPSTGESFTLKFANTGNQASGISKVDVERAQP